MVNAPFWEPHKPIDVIFDVTRQANLKRRSIRKFGHGRSPPQSKSKVAKAKETEGTATEVVEWSTTSFGS